MPKTWTDEEIEILKKHYLSTSKEILRKLLPNKTQEAIEHKAFRLGLYKINPDKWTDEELANLIHLWPNASKDIIQRELSTHSWIAIKRKASILGLKKILPQERPILSGKQYKSNLLIKTGERIQFGIVSDTHYGSKYAQISWLHEIYKLFNKREVEIVFHAGDLTDGNGSHYPGQRFEMHITGADNLKNFTIKNYPYLQSGKTYIIAGWHDLDLWTREGYDILDKICQGRKDLVYLGQNDAYWILGGRKIYIIHPGGGTAYALSYRPQKLVESFASENKPHIIIIGHYHKAEFIPVLRNVYIFQASCFQYQTPYAIRHNLQWHYGGWLVEMLITKQGISDIKTEFIPFYKPVIDDYRNYE